MRGCAAVVTEPGLTRCPNLACYTMSARPAPGGGTPFSLRWRAVQPADIHRALRGWNFGMRQADINSIVCYDLNRRQGAATKVTDSSIL
jgi:hypothetical protein